LSKEDQEEHSSAKTAEAAIEVFMPRGMQFFTGLYWTAGLTGIMLGTLAINQGFFERYFDTQFLLIVQGSALAALGGAMFLVATGIMSGARWSTDAAKRTAGISVVWSALGVTLAVYSAYNLPGLAYSVVLYGITVWLIVFGVAVGLVGLRYLYSEGASLRKYSEYVTTEVLSPEYRRLLPRSDIRRALPVIQRGRFCPNCGVVLVGNETVCPRCGAPRDAEYEAT